MSRLTRALGSLDIVAWLLIVVGILCATVIIVIALQTPNADCSTVIDDFQLPTLPGGAG